MPTMPPKHQPAVHPKRWAREYDAYRGTAHQRGYNAKWQAARRTYLTENPLCAECQRSGRVASAQVVDHIRPHRGDMELFWDSSNWQALCVPCHSAKTARGL